MLFGMIVERNLILPVQLLIFIKLMISAKSRLIVAILCGKNCLEFYFLLV